MAKNGEKSTGKTEQALFLPGPENWELWRGSVRFGLKRSTTTDVSTPVPNRIPSSASYVFPVTHAFAVPFWASTDDPDLIEDVGDMQLEKLGLKPAAAIGQMREFRIVDHVGNRTLVVANVLATPNDLAFPRTPPPNFELSPYLYPLGNDCAVVWRELGRLVLAITRTNVPLYFQMLSSHQLDEDALQEIKCIILQLRAQGVSEGIDELVAWLGPKPVPEVVDLVKRELDVPVRFGEPPAPNLPEEKSTLVPEDVAYQRGRREGARKLKNRVLLFSMLYLIVIGVFAGRLFMKHQQTAELRAEVDALRPGADQVLRAQGRWDLLEDALIPDTYPVELLDRCFKVLPSRGVQLEEFQVSDGKIFMRGKAARYDAAIGLKNDLEKSPLLAGFEWDFPKPDIQPDGSALFNTTGKKKSGAAQTQ